MGNHRAKVLIFVVVAGLLAGRARADMVQDGGAWLVFLGQGSFKEVSPRMSRLRWWLDGQVRFNGEAEGLKETILRTGIGWSLTPTTSLWLGYGWVRDYPGPANAFDEQEIWQQFLWTPRLGQARLAMRTRLEERFRGGTHGVGWRLRQSVKLLYPILPSERLFFAASEEAFANLNTTGWGPRAGFDQNRIFVGLHAPISHSVQFELGYLNRFLHRPGREGVMENLAMVALFFKPG